MTRIKRIPANVWPALLFVVGVGVALAGVFLLAGLAVALVVGGVVAAVVGALVDVE